MMDARDGGMKSRKLLYAAITSLLIFTFGVLCGFWPALRGSLDVVVGGLVGALGLYSGSNVSNKWVMAKHAPQVIAAAQRSPIVQGGQAQPEDESEEVEGC